MANVQADVWEWADGSPFDWTAWASYAPFGFIAPNDNPQSCDLYADPVDYSQRSTTNPWFTESTCGARGADHVSMNMLRDGTWVPFEVMADTCLTMELAYMCGYPCGPSWTAPLVTKVTTPTFAQRFDLAGQHITLRHLQLNQFVATGGGGVELPCAACGRGGAAAAGCLLRPLADCVSRTEPCMTSGSRRRCSSCA